MTKSTDFLDNAKKIQEDRAKQYDSAQGERSMAKTVAAFNTITSHTLTEAEGWLFMQILKDVRQWQTETYHEDSAVDSVSYASLKAEALSSYKQSLR